MAGPSGSSPRKGGANTRRTPSTPRSLELVSKVLEATAQVVADVGLEATSTNKIAARAGVSVGSIYQYFPDKEAVLDALVDDRIGRLEDLAAQRMTELRTHHYPEAAEAMLRATVDFHASEPVITPLLAVRIATLAPDEQRQGASARVHAIARAYLETYANDLEVEDPDLAATISMHVVLHFAPLIAMSPSGSDERERFVAEIVRMLSTWVGATR